MVTDDRMHSWVWAEQLAWWGLSVETAPSMTQTGPDSADHDAVLLDLDDGLELRVEGDHESLLKPVLPSELRSALLRLVAGEPAAGAAVAQEGDRPSKGRVLVVEDNPVNQLVATGLLTALGYATDTADDGLAAIEAAREGDFDAILMDVQMPHMDGYTATRHIRSHETGTRCPIIAMTAAVVEGERERCLEAGMDDFLTKPVRRRAARRDAGALAGAQPAVRRPARPRPARGAARARRPRRGVVVRRPGDRQPPPQRRGPGRDHGRRGGVR